MNPCSRLLSGLSHLASPFALRALRTLDPEKAHTFSLEALKMGLQPRQNHASDPRLALRLCGLDFTNPVGLAAGYDKSGEVVAPLSHLGFGFIEIGSVTPRPQSGNPKPRLFRLPESEAIINRMGFNNDGLKRVLDRAENWPVSPVKRGINLGANKDSPERIKDYIIGYQQAAPLADYITVNISSPNTEGLRALQAEAALTELLGRLAEARAGLDNGTGAPPLFLKLSPDMNLSELDQTLKVVRAHDIVEALIVSNTTTGRDRLPHSQIRDEAGGLSGRPLMQPSTLMLKEVAIRLEGTLPLIGVGGIMSGDDALTKIKAGASLVQVYSGLVYKGPALINDIITRLGQALDESKCSNITGLVGTGLDSL